MALFQPALPKYRIPIFNRLGAAEDINLTLFPSPRISGSSLPEATGAESFDVIYASMKRLGPFFRQPGQHTELTPGRFDVAVFSWNVRNIDLSRALRKARRLGVRTILWGHGFSKNEARWRKWLRDRQARRADALLFYNHNARSQLIEQGFDQKRLFVAANTLDQQPIQQARASWLDRPDELREFQEQHDLLDRPAIIFVSRLEPDNRVDWLIEAFARTVDRVPTGRLVLVGDGSQRDELQSLATRVGIADRTTFTGAIYDEMQLAPWMLSVSAFCYATNIGLSLLHAFGYGLPAVTSDATERQNPEIEALQPEENGLTWRHGELDDLAAQLARLMLDADLRDRLGAAGHTLAVEHYTIDRMVGGYLDCIRFAAGL